MINTSAIIVKDNPSWMPESLRKRKGDVIISFRFSDAERKIYRKRRPMPVSKWCEKHRHITMGSMPGRWRNEVTPYLAGIMDASFFSSVETIIICAAPQVGKSECVNNCIGYSIDRDPGPVLYIYPDELTAKENSNDRIQPMITSSPRLRTYLTGLQDDEAVTRINLQHMPIYMAWARSAARLANKPIRYEVFDETDKYPDTAGKREADPISLGEKRTITYRWGKKIWKTSTPTIETGPIWKALTTEAQCIFDYWVRCPACGKFQLMIFDTEKRYFRWPKDERDPEKIENENLAWYECAHCRIKWDDIVRDRAVGPGEWRDRETGVKLEKYLEKKKPKKIGFHIPSWISHFVGLSSVTGAFLRAQKDKTKLKDFMNNKCALPWKDYTQERKETHILALRDERPKGIVPGGGIVSALTAGIDTQDNGFPYEIRAWGWGQELESWQIRDGFVETFKALAKVLFEDIYKDLKGNEYFVRLVVQDAMGHRTSEVYDFARGYRGRLWPFQGVDKMAQPYKFSNIEFYPDKKGRNKPVPGGIKLLRADVNYYKNKLATKLEIPKADPGAWHLHSEATEDWAAQMCAEVINEKGLWECPEGKANHAWDCSVYNLVSADLLGIRFWKRPGEKPKETDIQDKGKGKKTIVKVVKSKFMQ